MGDSPRNADQSGLLRALSRAATGWNEEILRKRLPECVILPADGSQGGDRGTGSGPGNPNDLTEPCEHCGEPLPDTATMRRRFCSGRCQRAARWARLKQGPVTGRICPTCGGPVPDSKRNIAIYCSKRCGKKATDAWHRQRRVKACAECGETFHAHHDSQRFCGNHCSLKSTWRSIRQPAANPYPFWLHRKGLKR